MEIFFDILAFIAILTTSLVAGTVFAYGNSVLPGLRQADHKTFVLSIRHLTSSVSNWIFLSISQGALIGQIGFIAVAVYLKEYDKVIIGSIAVVFYVATLLTTFLGNLPLNNAIISAELPKTDGDAGWQQLREKFEFPWIRLNHLRTVTCIISASALLVALLIN